MTINILEDFNTQLRKTMLKLKEKQRLADQSQSRQTTESWSTMNHLFQQNIKLHAFIENHTQRKTFTKFISFKNEDHWFYKFSNSFIFTDEDESS